MTLVDEFDGTEAIARASKKYDTKEKVEKYAKSVKDTATTRRESNCVSKALDLVNIPRGASVLDLPCGTGRMIPLLKSYGFKLTCADVSAEMVEQAKLSMGPSGENCIDEEDTFCVASVFDTGFEDNAFDAINCHRLFQYFHESEERQHALKELKRICSGPIIVSFLCDLALDELWDRMRNGFRPRRKRSCVPVGYKLFEKDVQESGLTIKKWILMRPLVSKRWYAVLE